MKNFNIRPMFSALIMLLLSIQVMAQTISTTGTATTSNFADCLCTESSRALDSIIIESAFPDGWVMQSYAPFSSPNFLIYYGPTGSGAYLTWITPQSDSLIRLNPSGPAPYRFLYKGYRNPSSPFSSVVFTNGTDLVTISLDACVPDDGSIVGLDSLCLNDLGTYGVAVDPAVIQTITWSLSGTTTTGETFSKLTVPNTASGTFFTQMTGSGSIFGSAAGSGSSMVFGSSGNFTLYVEGETIKGCSFSDSLNIYIQKTDYEIAGFAQVCATDSVPYNIPLDAAYDSIRWEITGGGTFQNGNTILTNTRNAWVKYGSTPGQHEIRVFAVSNTSLACEVHDTLDVTITSDIDALIAGDTVVCMNSTHLYTANVHNLDSLNWRSTRNTSIITSLNPRRDSVNIFFPVAGLDTIIVSGRTLNGCNVTDTVIVDVKGTGIMIAGDTLICAGMLGEYKAFYQDGSIATFTNLNWSIISDVPVADATQIGMDSLTVVWQGGGIYQVVVAGMTTLGCTLRDTFDVSVIDTSFAIIGETTACMGYPAQFVFVQSKDSMDVLGPGDIVTWQIFIGSPDKAVPLTEELTDLDMNDTLIHEFQQGTFGSNQPYYIVASSTSHGCTITDTIRVNVIGDGQQVIHSLDAICAGGSTQFILGIPSNIISSDVTWTVIQKSNGAPVLPSNLTVVSKDTLRVTFPNVADTFVVRAMGIVSGQCEFTVEKEVVLTDDAFIIDLALLDTTCLSTDSVDYVLSVETALINASTFRWTITNLSTGAFLTPTLTNSGTMLQGTYRYPSAGRFRHEIIGEFGPLGCDINEVFTVTVKDTAYNILGDRQICLGDTTLYFLRQGWDGLAVDSIGPEGIGWAISDITAGILIPGGRGDSIRVVWMKQGKYSLFIDGTNSVCDCPIIASADVLVRDGGFFIDGPDMVCRGDQAGFVILNFDSSYVDDLIMDSTIWTVSHGTILNGQRTDSLTVRFNTFLGRDPIFVDTIRFRGMTDDGCRVEAQYLVPIRNNQFFLSGAANVCQGDPVNISLLNLLDSSLVTDIATINWVVSPGDTLSGGNTLTQTIDTSGATSPTWVNAGLYTVTAFGYTVDGCVVFASYTLRVNGNPNPEIQGDLNTCINTTDRYFVNINMNDIDSIRWGVRPYAGSHDSARIISGQGTREVVVDWKTTGSYFITVRGVTRGGCVFTDTITTTIINTATAVQMNCNNDLNVTLDDNCRVVLTPDMVLENPNPLIPDEQYEITIFDEETGQELSQGMIDISFIGKKLKYSILHECSGQSCWGYLTLEDKTIPALICGRDTVDCNSNILPTALNFGPLRRQGFPVPANSVVSSIGGTNSGMYAVTGFEKCGTATLTFRDSLVSNICQGMFGAIIYRRWTMENIAGLQSICTDTILVKRLTIDDLDLSNLKNFIGADGFECGIPYPTPSVTGRLNILSGQFCFNIDATFSDVRTNFCGEQSYRIVRTWTILDWCTGDVKIHTQTIDVLDREGPVITLSTGNINIMASDHSCTGVVDLTNAIVISDRCSEVVSRRVRIFEKDRFGKLLYTITDGIYTGLVFDESVTQILIAVDAKDACDKTSEREVTRTISIVDNIKPIPICDENTVISIGANGWAIADYHAFDDKSWDNCAIKSVCVTKMPDLNAFDSLDTNRDKLVPYAQFNAAISCKDAYENEIIILNNVQMIHRDSLCREYVKFCCSDAMSGSVLVSLTVTDRSGNTNSCMVSVRVQDNSRINKVVTPQGQDLTISCVEDITPYLTNDGSAVTFLTSVCGLPMPPDSYTAQVDTNSCGVGRIIRRWAITDDFGNSESHTQTVTIGFPGEIFNPANVLTLWPIDYEGAGCPGSGSLPENLPVINRVNLPTNFTCSSLTVSYQDLIFRNVEGFCAKILRTWTVMDWCQTRPNNPSAGIYTHVQVLKLVDNQAPNIIAGCESERFEVSNSSSCSAFISTRAAAMDCHDPEELEWTYEILDFDNTIVLTGKSNRINTNLGIGIYTINWIVEDPCGNLDECTKTLEVVDTRGPSITCRDIERSIGSDGRVRLTPNEFIANASDNCSDPSSFIYRFNAVDGQQELIFECAMLEGQATRVFNLTIFVLDLLGNASTCNVQLRVNAGTACPANIIATSIAGAVYTEQDYTVDNVAVTIVEKGASALQTAMTPLQGSFAFGKVPMNRAYEITAKRTGDYMNGVSTLDIILIQRHLLGLRKLDSPYKLIAADVDGSNHVSTIDIIHLRKLLLGISEDLPVKRSWTFVDEEQKFQNPDNPFPYLQSINIDRLNNKMDNANFIAVKMGDVNNNVQLLSVALGKARSVAKMNISDVSREGDRAILSLTPASVQEEVFGVQMELSYDPIKVQITRVKALDEVLDSEKLIIDPDRGRVLISWNEQEAIKLTDVLPMLQIEAIVLDPKMELSEAIRLVDQDLRPELYTSEGFDIQVNEIVFSKIQTAVEGGLVVAQNTPNPFKGSTEISFYVPKEGKVSITVHDLTGKVIIDSKEIYNKGWQKMVVDASKLPGTGMYVYQVMTGNEIQSKKMILID